MKQSIERVSEGRKEERTVGRIGSEARKEGRKEGRTEERGEGRKKGQREVGVTEGGKDT